MAIERKAHATWEGDLRGGSGRFDLDSGAITGQEVTFASRFEQPGGKTSPEELIAAAEATYFSMALANEARDRRGLHARPDRRGLPHHDHAADRAR